MIVDSALGNLNNHVLEPEKPGILLIFNEENFGLPLNIKLEIESDIAQTMTINSSHEIYSVELLPGKNWYKVHFNKGEDAFNLKIQDKPVEISAYALETEE